MDFFELAKTRRSVKAFTGRVPAKADIQKIIEAGLWAPSGLNRQSPIVLAVTNKATRDELSDMNRRIGGWTEGFDPFYGAPVVLVVLADSSVPTRVYDGSLVMQNMMLAAHELGISSCWIHRAKEEFESDEGKALLRAAGITGDYEGIGHCLLGYASKNFPATARKSGRVFWIE